MASLLLVSSHLLPQGPDRPQHFCPDLSLSGLAPGRRVASLDSKEEVVKPSSRRVFGGLWSGGLSLLWTIMAHLVLPPAAAADAAGAGSVCAGPALLISQLLPLAALGVSKQELIVFWVLSVSSKNRRWCYSILSSACCNGGSI